MASAASAEFSPPGAAAYSSDTMTVGDGTWDFSRNTYLLPNLQGLNFDTMRYNGMGNRFSTLAQYHRIVLAHGIMAGIVFLLLVPTATMMARFYSRQPGYAVVYHAQLQVLAGLMVLVIFILGYFAVGPNRSLSNPHHGIGVAIFVLFILQIIGGRLIRRITKVRSLRIMIHQWFGRAIALLGIVQIPLGLTLYGSPRYLFILYALWMAFLLFVYFILSYRSAGRREMYMTGARSEAGQSRVTESEYFSTGPTTRPDGWMKWLGPLAAGAGVWALLGRKKTRDRSVSPRRDRSRSYSRSRGPEVLPSRRGSDSYLSEKYSELPASRADRGGQGGIMKIFGGAAAALGAGKLLSTFTRRRQNRDKEYSVVSTETPRRRRSGRGGTTLSEFSSDYTENFRRGPESVTNTTLLPPSANPPLLAQARSAAEDRDLRRPTTPRPMRARDSVTADFDESEYSSYVSPSRRPVEGRSGGGFAKGLLSGLGGGWFARKMAERRSKREEDRLREEEEMRSGTQGSRYTGDGYPSPTRRTGRRFADGQSMNPGRDTDISELTESSLVSRPPAAGRASSRSRSRSRSRHAADTASMPAMPPDPDSEVGDSRPSIAEVRRPERRPSERRRRAGERAAAAAAARASDLAVKEERRHRDDRERYGSPTSQPVSVKLKVHDDRDRNVTLRRLTEEEAMASRAPREHGDSESSLSGLEPPGYGQRYRRDSSQQRRAERAAERAAERTVEQPTVSALEEQDHLAPLSPPHPAFAKAARRGKDSAYYSGQPGPSGSAPQAGQTVSSLGSGDSHGTWSQMSPSPSGPRGPESGAAEDRRRRRRQERRTAASTSTRPDGQDMFE